MGGKCGTNRKDFEWICEEKKRHGTNPYTLRSKLLKQIFKKLFREHDISSSDSRQVQVKAQRNFGLHTMRGIS